ncbi:helix-turn-helix transcriptional regulator [Micromonospora sp. NPDC049679]|uniref:helix-turn-helix domain-containing protein n=1 Tax=Micromonospora sp. NPDC049679 TaxID=3155920 RepID=UPI0033DCFE17
MRRRRLGAELRRLRETAGLTGDQVIERVGWASASKLSRLENGRSRPGLGDVLDLLELYAVDGAERDDLMAIAREAGDTRAWLRSYPAMTQRQRAYAELEAGCADISEYAPVIVPGLLQTPEYARVRIVSAQPLTEARPPDHHEIDHPETEVAARLARQSLLSRGDDPPRYVAVLEESALTGRSGPPEVLRAQLQHLRRVAALPNVTLRVLPPCAVVAEWYLPETAFSIYRFAEPEDPSAVAIEALSADMVLTDEAVLARYTQVFDWLCAAARSPDESLEWITEAAWRKDSDSILEAPPRDRSPMPPRQQRRHPRTDGPEGHK